MTYFLRRLPLSRLLLVCGLVVVLGVSATALAFALGTGPTPPPKPLADAVHRRARAPHRWKGSRASIQLTDHLLEGANLASRQRRRPPASWPPARLLTGASGRLWIAKDGRARLELQSEKGDTQIFYDGHTVSVYDASSNTLYRYTVPAHEGGSSSEGSGAAHDPHEPPTVAKIEEAISHSGPRERLRRDADRHRRPGRLHGARLPQGIRQPDRRRRALLGRRPRRSAARRDLLHDELRAGDRTGGHRSLLRPGGQLGVRIQAAGRTPRSQEIVAPEGARRERLIASGDDSPTVTTHGHGIATVAALESKAKAGANNALPRRCPKACRRSRSAASKPPSCRTELGTLLSFERSGVRYLLVGAVDPAPVEAVAKGL